MTLKSVPRGVPSNKMLKGASPKLFNVFIKRSLFKYGVLSGVYFTVIPGIVLKYCKISPLA